MASRLPTFKRIRIEDFPEEFQPLVEKLSDSLNYYLETIINLLNKSLTFDENIKSDSKELNITVDASGTPRSVVEFKLSSSDPIQGMLVIDTFHSSNSNIFPTAAVQCFFTQSGQSIRINKVRGLQENVPFVVKIITIS